MTAELDLPAELDGLDPVMLARLSPYQIARLVHARRTAAFLRNLGVDAADTAPRKEESEPPAPPRGTE